MLIRNVLDTSLKQHTKNIMKHKQTLQYRLGTQFGILGLLAGKGLSSTGRGIQTVGKAVEDAGDKVQVVSGGHILNQQENLQAAQRHNAAVDAQRKLDEAFVQLAEAQAQAEAAQTAIEAVRGNIRPNDIIADETADEVSGVTPQTA